MLPPNYEYSFTGEGDDPRRLVVLLAHGLNAPFAKADFSCPTLRVWEPRGATYYLRAAKKATSVLARFIKDGRYQEVAFVGHSKGGFGALAWATAVAPMVPYTRIVATVFSPQSCLHQPNSLKFPSYLTLLDKAANNEGLNANFQRMGCVPPPKHLNLAFVVHYASGVEEDVRQAERLSGARVSLHPIPVSTHNTLAPFVADMSDLAEVERLADSLLRVAEDDDDLASTLGDHARERIVAEYHALAPLPSLAEAVAMSLDEHPSRTRLRLLLVFYPIRQVGRIVKGLLAKVLPATS